MSENLLHLLYFVFVRYYTVQEIVCFTGVTALVFDPYSTICLENFPLFTNELNITAVHTINFQKYLLILYCINLAKLLMQKEELELGLEVTI